jgi:hypothetical protein
MSRTSFLLLSLSSLLVSSAWVPAARASQAEVHGVLRKGMLAGDVDGASLDAEGVVRVGARLQPLVREGLLPGPVVSIGEVGSSVVVSTAAPGKLWKVEGDRLKNLLTSGAPLLTGVVGMGNKTFALQSPNAGAVLVDDAGKTTSWTCPQARLLLAAAADGQNVLAVGGGDEGVLVSFAPGKPSCDVVATTQEPLLRSIAVATVNGSKRVYVGGAEEGLVYELRASNLVAILDAGAEEVTGIVVLRSGVVHASVVDSDGKLSKLAAKPTKTDDADEDPPKRKKSRPHQVKASELWRVDTAGHARVVWQSKQNGIYAMATDGEQTYFATGANGRLYRIGGNDTDQPSVWASRDGVDELTSLRMQGKTLVVGSAHAAGLWRVEPATTGTWTSEVLDAGGSARLGRVRVDAQGDVRLSARTGNTSNPKEAPSSWSQWSAWVPVPTGTLDADGASLGALPMSRYVQVRAELKQGASMRGMYVSYLRENTAPEVAAVDVLAPGWKLVANPRDAQDSRSVSLSERPFLRFLDRAGSQLPRLDERPYAKQTFDVGYRTVYVSAEDDDKDALRYRFSLSKAGAGAAAFQVVKDWSEEPFWSAEATRLVDGDYLVQVEVDDMLTNGPGRAKSAKATSSVFVVSHQAPNVRGSAVRAQAGMVVELAVDAALPLVAVRCTTGLAEWLPLDPQDGVLDGRKETFKGVLPSSSSSRGVSCEVYDEALNFGRIELPVR